MKITALIRGKKSKRINVFVDEEYSFSVEETTLVKENLFKGKELSQEEIERIKEKDLVEKFTFRSIEQIGRRPRSENEIKNYVVGKLRNKKFYDLKKEEIEVIVGKVVEKLKSKNYLNDQEFATWWVKSRREHRPRGIQALKQELFKKGIDKSIIKVVLDRNFDRNEEIESARSQAEKKLENIGNKGLSKLEVKARLSRYLAGKGYKWETISEVFKLLKLKQ